MREHVRTLITEDPGADHSAGSKKDVLIADGILEAFMDGKICISWDPQLNALRYRALLCVERKKVSE